MESNSTVIKFENVVKKYKLYKNDKKRFLAIFSKRVKYKEKLAVNNVSFSINRGESVALFGRNGAGKSTILKMVTGVAYPTAGEITLNGRVSALLELTSGFDPDLTGRDNIYLKGQLQGLTNQELALIEDDIIEFAEIGEYIDQPVRSYSSGMKSRLGFAIAVNIRPEILIVDEALSVGDKAFREKCLAKVKDIIENDGATLLFVTHSVGTARKFCERGIVMKSGEIMFDGPIDDAIALYDTKKKTSSNEKKRTKTSSKLAEAPVLPAKTAEGEK